ARQTQHVARAEDLFAALLDAGVVEELDRPDDWDRTVRVTIDLQQTFALNQPLAPFALAALDLLDPESDTFVLDTVSVIEAVLDDPRPILRAQLSKAKGEAVAAMKAEGMEYDERMAALDEITWPKPLADLLEPMFDVYRERHPWVAEHPLSPKSVARDLWERAMDFGDYVRHYQLARSEGTVLRYLTDVYKTLLRTIPEDRKTDELIDLTEWLGELVRQVDSSLLDEWEELRNPTTDGSPDAASDEIVERPPPALTSNRRAFTVLVRNALFQRVEHIGTRQWQELEALDGEDGWTAQRWFDALAPYFEEHGSMGIGADARNPALLLVDEHPADHPGNWLVRQILHDPSDDHDWRIHALVDLAASDEEGRAIIHVQDVSPQP
ncbi:MAG: DUF3516 domain-containing protein, partial [Aquihabitans sp.]